MWSAIAPLSERFLTAVSCHWKVLPPSITPVASELSLGGSGDSAPNSCHMTEIQGFDIQFLYHDLLIQILY